LEALVKAEIRVPACRQAGSWQIFVTKFSGNICGYTVAVGRQGRQALGLEVKNEDLDQY
jgi:hypothetical protein